MLFIAIPLMICLHTISLSAVTLSDSLMIGCWVLRDFFTEDTAKEGGEGEGRVNVKHSRQTITFDATYIWSRDVRMYTRVSRNNQETLF